MGNRPAGSGRAEDDHYPYKLDDALAVLDRPADYGYHDVNPAAFTSKAIAEATAEYVDAQHEFYTGDGESLDRLNEAEKRLVEARQAHRQGRSGVTAVSGG